MVYCEISLQENPLLSLRKTTASIHLENKEVGSEEWDIKIGLGESARMVPAFSYAQKTSWGCHKPRTLSKKQ